MKINEKTQISGQLRCQYLPAGDQVAFTGDIQVDLVGAVTKWWQQNGDKVCVLCDDWSHRFTNQDTGHNAKVSDVNTHHLAA